jgi:hypothetical protein
VRPRQCCKRGECQPELLPLLPVQLSKQFARAGENAGCDSRGDYTHLTGFCDCMATFYHERFNNSRREPEVRK